MKTVIVCSGSDWYDAGFDDLKIPDDLDLEQANHEYQGFLFERNLFIRSSNLPSSEWPEFLTFPEWLKKNKGAEDAGIEQYWEV